MIFYISDLDIYIIIYIYISYIYYIRCSKFDSFVSNGLALRLHVQEKASEHEIAAPAATPSGSSAAGVKPAESEASAAAQTEELPAADTEVEEEKEVPPGTVEQKVVTAVVEQPPVVVPLQVEKAIEAAVDGGKPQEPETVPPPKDELPSELGTGSEEPAEATLKEKSGKKEKKEKKKDKEKKEKSEKADKKAKKENKEEKLTTNESKRKQKAPDPAQSKLHFGKSQKK